MSGGPFGYKDCPGCKNPVHHMSKACKLCGAPSPWAKGEAVGAEPPAGEGSKPAAASPPGPAASPAGGPTIKSLTEPATAADIEALKPLIEKVVAAVGVPPGKANVVGFEPYVVMQSFTHQFGDVLGVFKKGDVVSDFQTVAKLKAAGQPIAPASQVDNIACCPDCQKLFIPWSASRGKVA